MSRLNRVKELNKQIHDIISEITPHQMSEGDKQALEAIITGCQANALLAHSYTTLDAAALLLQSLLEAKQA